MSAGIIANQEINATITPKKDKPIEITNDTGARATELLLGLQNRIAELENRTSYLEKMLGLPLVNINGLVGYWRFDEGQGVCAYDSSGEANHGVFLNGVTWVTGKYNEAISLDGQDDYVYVNSSPSLQFSESISVECWFNARAKHDAML